MADAKTIKPEGNSTTGSDEPASSKPNTTTKNEEPTEDMEARMKETLTKKKILQKQSRRKSDGKAPNGKDDHPAKDDKDATTKKGEENGVDASEKKDATDPPNSKNGGDANAKKVVAGGDDSNRARKRRRRRDRRRRGERGADGGGPGGPGGGRGGGMMDSRDHYRRGPPPPGDYNRGDPYGRGGPPQRDYYNDRRGGGGGWGDDRGGPPPRGGGWRDERDYDRRGGGGGGRDDYWDGPPRGRPVGRRDERDVRGDIYGRNNAPPPRGGSGGGEGGGSRGGGGSKDERGRSASRSRSYSRSSSRSYSSGSRSRSHSGSRSYSSRSSRSRSYSRSLSRSYSRSPSHDSARDTKRQRSGSHDSRSRSKSSPAKDGKADKDKDSSKEKEKEKEKEKQPTAEELAATKDQRTVFVSQLVMRADERDIGRYFKRSVRTKVRDVILLKDKRTGRHKGCAYVEMGSMEDVDRALGATGKTPDFQRFPILVKRTESEKNVIPGGAAATTLLVPGMTPTSAPVQMTADGKRIEAQKVYVGSVDRCVTQAQLFALFSQFGTLDKVLLQMDMTTGMSRGFAFLSYRDAKDANLAIQTMSGQMLAGRPLKTGWANQQASAAGVVEVKTDQFPDDANDKIQKVNAAMNQLTGASLTTMIGQVDASAQQALLAAGPAGALGIMPSAQLASVADAALDMALGVAPTAAATTTSAAPIATAATSTVAAPASIAVTPAPDAKIVGRSDNPTEHILVHNMYDKDEETEQGWEEDIKLDFEEECAQYGKITAVTVMSKDPGGKIYASFVAADGAMNCAKNLAGRWFDKRQLRVEFVDSIPSSA